LRDRERFGAVGCVEIEPGRVRADGASWIARAMGAGGGFDEQLALFAGHGSSTPCARRQSASSLRARVKFCRKVLRRMPRRAATKGAGSAPAFSRRAGKG